MKQESSNVNYSEIYKDKIFQTFKKVIRDFLDRGKVPSYAEVEIATLTRLGLNSYITSEVSYLKDYFESVINLTALKVFMYDNSVDEIIVHNSTTVQLLKGGLKVYATILPIKRDDYLLSLEVLVLKNGQIWNFSNPFASFHTVIAEENFRVSICHECISNSSWPKIFIRKVRNTTFPLSNYIGHTTTVSSLENLIESKKNILIAGATGSGKTSFVKSMLSKTDRSEHIIILEDTHEIDLDSRCVTNLVAGKGESKSLKSFLGHAMRMTPDRIVLGEMRTDEVIPFVLAMNTGHKGLISTIHANSAKDALHRVAMLFSLYSTGQDIDYKMIMELVCRNIDSVIFLRNRKVAEIIDVVGQDRGNPIHRVKFDYSQLKRSA